MIVNQFKNKTIYDLFYILILIIVDIMYFVRALHNIVSIRSHME